MLTELREHVAQRVDEGQGLERIEEEVVNVAPIDDERRSALWLYAWLREHDSVALAGR